MTNFRNRYRGRQRTRTTRLVPALLATAILIGLLGTTMASANNDLPPECSASATALNDAKTNYANNCALPRIDCDRIDGIWYCSSRVIGSAAPGGVTDEDVGSSAIGTITVTNPPPTTQAPVTEPPATEPPDTEPPVTEPPVTEPSVTQPSTTQAPPTTEPPTTQPATTEPPTTQPPDTQPPSVGGVNHTYPKTDGPDRNPMKGWNSGWSDDRPEATVGFQYIKWQDLEPTNGNFDFSAVEDVINRSGSKDRHLILRLYCDWWGENEESRGCPEWIYSEVGVDRIRGDNGRYITDYNDPRYIEEATQAITALGERYDDDPRLYAFQIGVIGYWGEWHTWGSQVDGGSYDITTETETKILDAYRNAFDRTQLMARYPYRSILATAEGIGFHNDYFRPNNDHSAEFDKSVFDNRRWEDGTIGGEVPPGLSSDDYRHLYQTSQGREMIETGHYSTMKPGSVSNQHSEAHLELHKRFGYNYQIDGATFAETAGAGQSVAVAVDATNIGVAPFYYDWQVQYALLDGNNTPVVIREATAYDLRSVLPGQSFSLRSSLPLDGVNPGQYQLAIRVIQPGADETKSQSWGLDSRIVYVLFANDLPVVDGAWNGQNALVGGWSVLGSVTAGQ